MPRLWGVYAGVPDDVRERIQELAVAGGGKSREAYVGEWHRWIEHAKTLGRMKDAAGGRWNSEHLIREHVGRKPEWLLMPEELAERQKAEAAAEKRERAALAGEKAALRKPGPYSVIVSGAKRDADFDWFLRDMVGFKGWQDVIKHATHIDPVTVAEGVSKAAAIKIKEGVEEGGGRVRIQETRMRPDAGRKPIPEPVRNAVWRRDEGRCVDCGSRERLEFDHIIPVAKGGANTARNIELRCESCNRRKGARI